MLESWERRVLQAVNEQIANSLQHALEAETRAQAVADPKLRAEYEQMAKGWRTLARSCEFQQSLRRFIAFQTSRKTSLITSNLKQESQESPTQDQHSAGAASSRNESWITTLRAHIQEIWTDEKPAKLLERFLLVVLLYVAAIAGRQALHPFLPGTIRYLTFFPALLAAGLLCGLAPSLTLLAALATTGIFFYDPRAAMTIPMRLVIAVLFVLGGAGVVIPAWYAARTQRMLRARDRRLALLNGELRHRVKNLFALTCSICSQSARSTPDLHGLISRIIGRIQAIATAQDYLSITSDKGSELRTLIQAVIGPLCPDAARLQISGSPVTLSPGSTTSFALVLHELATNAVKYGAWQSGGHGRIEVAWQTEDDQLHFQWRERGTPISPPKREGFGTIVISRSLGGARVEQLFHSDGVEWTIRLQLTG